MLVKNSRFPSDMELEEIKTDNFEVFVPLENRQTCTLFVQTFKKILFFDRQRKYGFFRTRLSLYNFQKAEKKIIGEAIKDYAENNLYWLKWYHFGGQMDNALFTRLQAEHIKLFREIDLNELDNSNSLELNQNFNNTNLFLNQYY